MPSYTVVNKTPTASVILCFSRNTSQLHLPVPHAASVLFEALLVTNVPPHCLPTPPSHGPLGAPMAPFGDLKVTSLSLPYLTTRCPCPKLTTPGHSMFLSFFKAKSSSLASSQLPCYLLGEAPPHRPRTGATLAPAGPRLYSHARDRPVILPCRTRRSWLITCCPQQRRTFQSAPL